MGYGTHGIGGLATPDHGRRKEWRGVLENALEVGYRHFDTSEAYGDGLGEELLGEVISSYPRSQLFLTTKVWHTNLSYEKVLAALKGSLARLDTDYIDLYLVHKPSPDMDLKGTMEALEKAQLDRQVRAIGVGNFTPQLVEKAQAFLKNVRLAAVQNQCSIIEHDDATIKDCQKNGRVFIASRPLGKGKVLDENSALLRQLSEKYKKTASQIALNWLIMKKNVVAIPKATTKQHMAENLGAQYWEMHAVDYELLDSTSKKTTLSGRA